ncbi:hypothetical protein GCM10011363_39420 [Marivita lacus]|uniref:Uncharacterized protein n=1 Tax=Marivita lacus TaxID=1323742 RepID=A0ABQ1L971_9RHOB|nr:hypothetical protein GCM10011363_39420 [Marivita lacus]
MRNAKCSEFRYAILPPKITNPATTVSINIDAPDMKYITPQPNSTKAAWPKSGCRANMRTILTVRKKEKAAPGGPFGSSLAARNHAITITNVGFRNSDG